MKYLIIYTTGSVGIALVKQHWNDFGTLDMLGWQGETSQASCPYELESQLFIVRMWREDLGDGQSEWRAHILAY